MVNLLNLLSGYETTNLEFKQAYSPSLLKTVSAFANQHDGMIFLGVDDQGQIIGIDHVQALRLTLENAINDNIDPRPFYELTSQLIEGKTILILKIQKGEYTPYYYGHKAYVRSDTASVAADRLTLSRLILAGQNTNFEDLPAVEQHLTFSELKENFRTSRGVQSLSTDLQKTLNLISNGKKSNAAALLSDQNPVPGASLALLVFQDQNMNIADRLILERRSLLVQFTASLDFFKKHLRVAERIDGIYRQTIEEVPLAAFREAVANAIIHRDYQMSGQIKIEFWPDRITIYSPGGLPPGLGETEYLEGHYSVFRNPTIADIFMRLGLAEKLATGIRRIRQYYFGRVRQPEFVFQANSLAVVLPREPDRLNGQLPAAAGLLLKDSSASAAYDESFTASPDQGSHKEQLIHLLRGQKSISRGQAEALLNLGKTQTCKILRQLELSGQVYRTGEGRCTRYHLLER